MRMFVTTWSPVWWWWGQSSVASVHPDTRWPDPLGEWGRRVYSRIICAVLSFISSLTWSIDMIERKGVNHIIMTVTNSKANRPVVLYYYVKHAQYDKRETETESETTTLVWLCLPVRRVGRLPWNMPEMTRASLGPATTKPGWGEAALLNRNLPYYTLLHRTALYNTSPHCNTL